jgi:hypothetical protein
MHLVVDGLQGHKAGLSGTSASENCGPAAEVARKQRWSGPSPRRVAERALRGLRK